MDEDGGLAVVRPTRWKTRDDHLVKENADPSEATGGKLSLGSRDDDDADHDDVNMDDVSREYDERVVREDDAAFDQLLDLAEGAMHSVRLKASPAKTEPRETEDDDDDDELEVDEYGEEAWRRPRCGDGARRQRGELGAEKNSDVSASSSFDFDVDEPDADDRGGATTTRRSRGGAGGRPRRARARRRDAATRPARVSGATRLSASRADPSLATAKAWLSEFAALGAKQRAAETALAGTLGDDARPSTRRSARRSATTCLRGWSACAGACARGARRGRARRGGVRAGARSADGWRGADVVALKEAQKAAYDRLAREERDLTGHCDDFAQRVETWGADTSDPVWAGVLRDASGKRQHAGRGRRVYGAPTPKRRNRGAAARARRKNEPSPTRDPRRRVCAVGPRGAFGQSLRVCGVLRGEAREAPGRARPGGRAASARSPGETRGGSPGSASGKSSSAQKAAAAAARRSPRRGGVRRLHRGVRVHGRLGGCRPRAVAPVPGALQHALRGGDDDGGGRPSPVRHRARGGCAARALGRRARAPLRKEEGGCARLRAAHGGGGEGARDALDAEIARVEEEQRAKASAKAAAARAREQAALREWKARSGSRTRRRARRRARRRGARRRRRLSGAG